MSLKRKSLILRRQAVSISFSDSLKLSIKFSLTFPNVSRVACVVVVVVVIEVEVVVVRLSLIDRENHRAFIC